MLKLFILAFLFIYAILVVQFENFIDPFIILLSTPLACLVGLSFMWLWLVGSSLNIYPNCPYYQTWDSDRRIH
ncbi:AcrB/AcrD/AcrF family protein [Hyalomma marginatum]|uniref:AcrB/AcrD/AcrF family protein n=1 Tax=Hyalomma marginatum TaxID=34627 RepID=A0A8S4C4R0_9ACAR|nr:AcrB/AcrD/AcrF family protein [Hyalomma marginatum]CAG7592909.1 AcrB/AcrD/AcrF family protein [Hyalomma marginatum]